MADCGSRSGRRRDRLQIPTPSSVPHLKKEKEKKRKKDRKATIEEPPSPFGKTMFPKESHRGQKQLEKAHCTQVRGSDIYIFTPWRRVCLSLRRIVRLSRLRFEMQFGCILHRDPHSHPGWFWKKKRKKEEKRGGNHANIC